MGTHSGDAARGTSEDARHLTSDVGRPVVSRIGGRVEVPARRREGFTSPKAPQDRTIVGDPRAGHRLKLRRRLRRGFRCTPPIGGVRFVGCHGVRGSREAPRLQPALRCAPPRPDRERLLRPGRRPERGASPHPRAPPPSSDADSGADTFPRPSFADPICPPPASTASHPQRAEAEKIMTGLQENEMMWTRADAILEQSQNPNTKFFALQVLDAVKYRWNALPDDQREGIKNFISNLIIKLSTDDASFRGQRAFISKINSVLVQILKHDWPADGRRSSQIWWARPSSPSRCARTA